MGWGVGRDERFLVYLVTQVKTGATRCKIVEVMVQSIFWSGETITFWSIASSCQYIIDVIGFATA